MTNSLLKKTLLIKLIFKTHLDIGFTDLAEHVMDDYFTQYIPKAIELARVLREGKHQERFVWTVGSWLIYQTLETASPGKRKDLERAIETGDIVWHGLPFTTHTELMDASLFRYGLGYSQKLDRRFGKKTVAAKMTDVPGHTRSMVPLLAEAGIEFLHIGVNPASTPPNVPPIFIWRHPGGAEIIVMYHKGTYGDLMMPENLDSGICFAHTGDNQGPPSIKDVIETYARLNEHFPDARIQASTLNAFALELRKIKSTLPVLTQELGDTWIHGVGSDPGKVALFREFCRLRNRWLSQDIPSAEKEKVDRFSDQLILIPEHTWGMDEKTHFPDTLHYSVDELRKVRQTEKVKAFEASWTEQRAYLSQAREALGQNQFGQEIQEAFSSLTSGYPDLNVWNKIEDHENIQIGFCTLSIDPRTGAITDLSCDGDRKLATPKHSLGLFRYEVFCKTDYDRFTRQYLQNLEKNGSWALPDFTKPGIEKIVKTHRMFLPVLDGIYRHREKNYELLLRLHMPDEAVKTFGAPKHIALVIRIGSAKTMEVTLDLFEKQACRLPVAMWFSFNPPLAKPECWQLVKMGQPISPLEVIENGNRHLHAVEYCYLEDGSERIVLESLDAPLVAPGEPMLLNFTNDQPVLSHGMHFNLYNNLWGTNFPMWSEEDMRFRFKIEYKQPNSPSHRTKS
jgi:hypothetical protein